jgi:hypothetical protein
MALFHLFHMMLHDVPQDSDTFPDQPSSEGTHPCCRHCVRTPLHSVYAGVAAGSRFIARVLEKGGLSGFIDCLKDSRPRLQQAYLNIFITVFSASYIDDARTDADTSQHNDLDVISNSQSVVCDAALKPLRFYFVKSQSQLLPVLSRLADQGGSSAIRGKATLAIELICRFQPSLLMGLSDCRFQHVLSKLLEHDEDERHGMIKGPVGGETGRTDTQSSYVHNCAVSMQRYLRYLLVHSLKGLATYLRSNTTIASPRANSQIVDATDLSSTNVLDASEAAQCSRGLYSTPSKGSRGALQCKTPGTNSHHQSPSPPPHSASKPTHRPSSRNSPSPHHPSDTPNTAAAKHTRVAATAAVTSRMTDYSAILRSCIQMTSHPTLRALVISGSYISSLASTLALLSQIIRQPEWASRLAEEGKDEVISIAEQAVLLALESVAQVRPYVE